VGQGVRTLAGKKSKLGACCAKGCDAGSMRTNPISSDGGAKPQAANERIVFMPVEMLVSSARRSKR
jgi:hypothetical protein